MLAGKFSQRERPDSKQGCPACLICEEVVCSKDLAAAKGVHGLHLQRMNVPWQSILLTLPRNFCYIAFLCSAAAVLH
jgi:hypothetical protein